MLCCMQDLVKKLKENVPELRRKMEEEGRRPSTTSSVFSSVNSQSSLASSFDGQSRRREEVHLFGFPLELILRTCSTSVC